jgi:CHAD domain-containing protein
VPPGPVPAPERAAGAQALIEFADIDDPQNPAEPATAMPGTIATFEFDMNPQDLPRLLRAPPVMARREGRVRTSALRSVWHDTATAELAEAGLALSEILSEPRGLWRLEQLRPNGAGDWLPATPAPLLGESGDLASLPRPVKGQLVPVAAFSGRQRVAALAGPATLTILEGNLRGVASDRPACRLLLCGAPADMAALAEELAPLFALSIPRAGLAAEAMSVASGMAPAPRRTGTPHVPPGASLDEAIGIVLSHLADVILHWAHLAPAGDTPEPVHQMRVAVRRMRSAISVFRRAAGPVLDGFGTPLRSLAQTLGAARDWDVFLENTGAAVGHAFPGDRRIEGLLAAAERKRREAYAALRTTLAGPDFRRLSMSLALLPSLRPWAADAGGTDMLGESVRSYAARTLERRLKHVTLPGDSLAALPADTLHEVRKQAKRLRYAAEFFAPLFADKPTRRFLRRLEQLQEALGAMNDAAVARHLMAQLGGGDRAFASGIVHGFVAAGSVRAGTHLEQVWTKFCRADVFWR